MDICSICLKNIDEENAPILTISGYGKPRYLCPHCEKLVSTVCESNDRGEVSEAIEKIGASLTVESVEDKPVISALNELFEEAKARLENPEAYNKAKEAEIDGDEAEGLCDSPESAATENVESEEIFDIPAELCESEEDRQKDEDDKKKSKIFDTVIGWAAAAILIGAIVFFVVKFIL